MHNKIMLSLALILGVFTLGNLSAQSDNYMNDVEKKTEGEFRDIKDRSKQMWDRDFDGKTKEERQQKMNEMQKKMEQHKQEMQDPNFHRS